ncbi:MAG TPA: hypothetical protein VGD53_20730 [Actinoallomurus sp.]|jgi:predicted MFS family arabinose efflux permease
MGVLSIVVSRPVSRRNLVRGPLIVSALSLLAASAGVLLLTAHAPVILLVGVTLIFGITIGTTVANQTALYAQAPADQIGTASGLFRTFGYLGSIDAADPDAGLHETLTEKVFPRQAHVITTTELPALLAA